MLFLFQRNEHSEIQNQPCTRIHSYEGGKKKLLAQAVIFIMDAAPCQMQSAAWYGLFSPPAFQDNNFNVEPELHFAFFKHDGNRWLRLLLN